jgi:mono/diheme cytochrome c family protein
MRRIALALVAVVFVFGVAACGGEEEASPEPEDTTGTITTTDTETTETETETDTETDDGTTGGDAAAGKEVFLGAAGCGSCHTLADAGTSGSIGPNLDDSQPSSDLVVDRVTNGAGAMPSFSDQLSEEEIANVAAYVSTAAGG